MFAEEVEVDGSVRKHRNFTKELKFDSSVEHFVFYATLPRC